MSENKMASFITLDEIVPGDETETNTYYNVGSIEVNPAYIVSMKRLTMGNIPATRIMLNGNITVFVTQTPEEIAQLQIQSVKGVMQSVIAMTNAIMEELDKDW